MADQDETHSTPTELTATQGPKVELLVDGLSAGDTNASTIDGKWDFTIPNLEPGMHIMTAESGGETSNKWSVNVQATSGSEDWSGFGSGFTFEHLRFYAAPSGLLLYSCSSGLNTLNGPPHTVSNGDGTLSLSFTPGQGINILAYLLPITATEITVRVGQTFNSLPAYKHIRFGINNDIITRDFDTTMGDKKFSIPEGTRWFTITLYVSPGLGYNPNLGKVSWRTP